VSYIKENAMNYNEASRERLIEILEEKDMLIQKLNITKAKLQYQAYMDCVTGVLSRRAGLEVLDTTIEEAAKHGENCIICFADIDDFKGINDTFGHNEGDKLLGEIGNVLKINIRKADTVFRIGGDEFVIIFPNTTLDDAKTICGRVCREIEGLRGKGSGNYIIGLSCGFAEYGSGDKISANELIGRADEGMYVGKRGKVRVLV
jgi:diguanylate cyclase (GGDEF)-like protein